MVGVTLQLFGTSLRTIGSSSGHSTCSSMTLFSCFGKGKRTLVIVSLCTPLTNPATHKTKLFEDVSTYTCCRTMPPTTSSSEDSSSLGFSHKGCVGLHPLEASRCVEDQLTVPAVLWPKSDIAKTVSCPIITKPRI
jgi:hypothetical protein